MISEDKYTVVNFWSKYSKINNIKFDKLATMKQIPLRLSLSEWEDLQAIQKMLQEKTVTKTIKFLIKYFLRTSD